MSIGLEGSADVIHTDFPWQILAVLACLGVAALAVWLARESWQIRSRMAWFGVAVAGVVAAVAIIWVSLAGVARTLGVSVGGLLLLGFLGFLLLREQ